MNLKNREIECTVRKAVQEVQYEPFEVVMTVKGTIGDDTDIEKEFDELAEFLESKVFETINKRLT